MKRKAAILASILLTLLIAFNVAFFNSQEQRKTVFITEVIDGDTFKSEDRTFRLVNINAPEKSEKGFNEAKKFLEQFEETTAEVEELSTDRYGRTLARIYSPDYINLEIVEKGLAKKFLVQDSELKKFDNAEKKAVENGIGLWKRSDFQGCIETQTDKVREIVKIKSVCGALNVQNFIVADESRKRYKFPDIAISEVNLHSFEGEDNETDVFWNNKGNIWNNDRDTIYLFDSEGLLAHHSSYGY